MIKKTPFNYSNDMDRRRQGLDAIVENLLPDVSTDDAGKIVKVSEAGKWTLGDDENTIIEANPEEGSASEELENLKIGNTIYSVNKPTFDIIKGLRITTADGGEYRTDRPTIRFYDDAGVELAIASSGYTASCDKSYAGSLDLTSVCSIATTDAPGAYTYIFNNDINVDTYHLIKLTNAGSFAGDIAKSIKLELTANGEDFVTLWEDPAITWSGSAGASRIIDIKTGAESSTILPIVTSADNGKVLSVVGGVWDKTNIPSNVKWYKVGWSNAHKEISLLDGKKFTDVQNDMKNGIFCILFEPQSNANNTPDRIYYPVSLGGSSIGIPITFFNIDILDGSLAVYQTNNVAGDTINRLTTP